MEYTIYDETGTRAVILPEKGATVASLTYNGEEFLYCNPENIGSDERPRCGIPFIFPSFGRLENGQYTYDGQTYHMGIHGFAHTSIWEPVARTRSSLKLALSENEGTMAQYPFRFRVELCFQVAKGVLTIHQTYTNRDSKPMPYQCGLHPYFEVPSSGEASVQLTAKYCTDTNNGRKEPFTAGCIGGRTCPGEKELSYILEQVNSPAVLSVPAKKRRVKLVFDKSFSNVVLWRLCNSGFLCVEPICGTPNGLNTGDCLMLQPGESRSAVISIHLTDE